MQESRVVLASSAAIAEESASVSCLSACRRPFASDAQTYECHHGARDDYVELSTSLSASAFRATRTTYTSSTMHSANPAIVNALCSVECSLVWPVILATCLAT